jgi:hypothetical protein
VRQVREEEPDHHRGRLTRCEHHSTGCPLRTRIVHAETLADMLRARSEPDPGESPCYGLGFWLDADSPQITMSGADAGAWFWSSHYPERGTTATVISTTFGGAWPVAEIVDSHA